LVRIMNNVIRFLVPWAFRGAGWVFGCFVLSLTSVFTGFPVAAPRIADAWVDRAVAARFPTRYVRTLYRIMFVVAWIDLIVAWVVASYVTVWLMRVVWRVVEIFLAALWLTLISML
jgi:hypothetical protein